MDSDCNDTCNISFEGTFGDYKPMQFVKPNYRPSLLKTIDDGRANPCNHCGKYPVVHDVGFKDKKTFSSHFYIECPECRNCNGAWYDSEESAIKAWNEENPIGKIELDKKMIMRKKFVEDILRYTKISD